MRIYRMLIVFLLGLPVCGAPSSLMAADLTGSYVSEITGELWFLNAGKRSTQVKLQQNGSKITGTFGKAGGEISGILVGNTIFFDWYSAMSNGKGEWTLVPASNRMTGTWHPVNGGTSGMWGLTRLGAAAEISTQDSISIFEEQPDIGADVLDASAQDAMTTAETSANPSIGDDPKKDCQMSEAARAAIDDATNLALQGGGVSRIEVLDLIDRAEMAAAPPTCDNDKAIALAEQAKRMAVIKFELAKSRSSPSKSQTNPCEKFTPGDLMEGLFSEMGSEGGPAGLITATVTSIPVLFVYGFTCLGFESSTSTTEGFSREKEIAYRKMQQYRLVTLAQGNLARNMAQGGGEYVTAMA